MDFSGRARFSINEGTNTLVMGGLAEGMVLPDVGARTTAIKIARDGT